MLSIKDIANLAGVSKTTVSRYLNGGVVSEKTRQILSDIIEQHQYTPNVFAQSLKAKKTNIIGVICPKLDSESTAKVYKGIDDVARQNNYELLLSNTFQDKNRELESLLSLKNQKVAGIIFIATQLTDDHIEVMKSINIPIVVVGQKSSDFNCVYHDDYKAGVLSATLLNKNNCKNSIFVSVDKSDIAVGIQRRNGFFDTCAKLGINVMEINSNFNPMNVYQSIFNDNVDLNNYDAIVCSTDNMCLGALKALNELDIENKSNILLMGFGGSKITNYTNPLINTVEYKYEESGKISAQRILNLINNNDHNQDVILNVQIQKSKTVDL